MKRNIQLGYEGVRRRMRLLGILRAADLAGLAPTKASELHALAYLTDALSPVWGLPFLDAQMLKRTERPYFPALQAELDSLVGLGVVTVESFEYARDADQENWRLAATYRLSMNACEPIFRQVERFEEQSSKDTFVTEVVYAAAGLGEDGIEHLGLLDATYSDPDVDIGGLIDMEEDEGQTASAAVAGRLALLLGDMTHVNDAQPIYLYLQHLSTGLGRA